jgi:hypothetical protein
MLRDTYKRCIERACLGNVQQSVPDSCAGALRTWIRAADCIGMKRWALSVDHTSSAVAKAFAIVFTCSLLEPPQS